MNREGTALQGHRERLHRAFSLGLALALPAVIILAAAAGPVKIPLPEVIRAVWDPFARAGPGASADPGDGGMYRVIVTLIRLPRAVLAALSGAALAVAGAAFQSVFHNPLADPYVLGASSGAALGAAVAVVANLGLSALGVGLVPIYAFAGALAAVFLSYGLARRAGGPSPLALLLAGVIVGSCASAALSLVIYFSGEHLRQITFWLMGGFEGTTWRSILIALPYLTIGGALVFVRFRELDALLLGDETARGLGVDAERIRVLLVIGASLLTAAAVAVSGPIGFVGLVVPHLVRSVIGAEHRRLLPDVAMAGAILMVAADTLARTIIAPTELPVGIVTALTGGPFFLWVLGRRRRFHPLGGRKAT